MAKGQQKKKKAKNTSNGRQVRYKQQSWTLPPFKYSGLAKGVRPIQKKIMTKAKTGPGQHLEATRFFLVVCLSWLAVCCLVPVTQASPHVTLLMPVVWDPVNVDWQCLTVQQFNLSCPVILEYSCDVGPTTNVSLAANSGMTRHCQLFCDQMQLLSVSARCSDSSQPADETFQQFLYSRQGCVMPVFRTTVDSETNQTAVHIGWSERDIDSAARAHTWIATNHGHTEQEEVPVIQAPPAFDDWIDWRTESNRRFSYRIFDSHYETCPTLVFTVHSPFGNDMTNNDRQPVVPPKDQPALPTPAERDIIVIAASVGWIMAWVLIMRDYQGREAQSVKELDQPPKTGCRKHARLILLALFCTAEAQLGFCMAFLGPSRLLLSVIAGFLLWLLSFALPALFHMIRRPDTWTSPPLSTIQATRRLIWLNVAVVALCFIWNLWG